MIKSTKFKCILSFILILLVLALAILDIGQTKSAQTESKPDKYNFSVVIDPGHGGIDPGSIGRSTKVTEREINLNIALELQTLLQASNINTTLTRKDENGLYKVYTKNYKTDDMLARKNIIENIRPNIVVSIHQNSFTSGDFRGAQVFYNSANPLSLVLAKSIQQSFLNSLEESKKETAEADYYILKCTNFPTVLCECGFLSNLTEEKLLVSTEYQKQIAYCIYVGIIGYLNSI